MADLNQYEISQILGSQMVPTRRGRFGNFGLLETTAEAVGSGIQQASTLTGSRNLGYEVDRVIVRAFEDVRAGASADALLWDRPLQERFVRRSRELGLDLEPRTLNRRLINVRKSKQRYKERGIVLSPTTRNEPRPGIMPRFAAAIEFSLVQLRYRYGLSIDDLLLDPRLSDRYVKSVLSAAPDLADADVRRAALCIRKSRFIKKHELGVLQSLNLGDLETSLSPRIPLNAVDVDMVPDAPGLIEIDERPRHLYVARVQSLRPLVEQFIKGSPFKIVQSSFWSPNFDEITLQFVSGKTVSGTTLQLWEQRLIHDFHPIFNWPVHHKTAA